MSQDINNLPCASSQPTAVPTIPVTIATELDPVPLFQFSNKNYLSDYPSEFPDDFPDELKELLTKQNTDPLPIDPDDVYNNNLAIETIIAENNDNWEKKKKEYEIQQQQFYVNSILEQIDKKYSSGFMENTFEIHAQLSYSKYWNAGSNIIEFFTNDDIETAWLGNSSNDMRSHCIIKDRSRNMVFEYHNAYGKMDIFPLYGIMSYLEAYDPRFLHSEEWINLNMSLPAYDMQPLHKLNKDDSSSQLQNDSEEVKNLCTICKVDMGPNNPRQLCRKTYCENEDVI